ncbi:TIGR02266 family protein, partial [Archangium sp.]|uniref:TIGR02266 family protein n=1 Tax=Archangium sp. TaxID=1872627 RepID=UPI002EDBB343
MTVEPKLLPLRIRLPYATEEEFIEKYGSNVARGGLFIATRSPKPEGTGLSFELVLVDGGRLLRGEGVVVKSQAEGPRAGMTVRFVRLDAFSKALIDRIVSRKSQLKEGTAESSPAPATPTPGPEQTPAVRTEGATTGKRGRPVISAEALRKQVAMSAPPRATPNAPAQPAPPAPKPAATGTPTVPPAPKPAAPATGATGSPKQAAPSSAKQAPPVAPQQAAPRPRQPAAKAPARPAVPPASKPAASPPAPARPPVAVEQQVPAPPEPPLAAPQQPSTAPPERAPVVAQVVPTEPRQIAPAASEPASPSAPAEREEPPRPTTQDLLANAVLEHLDPDAPESSPNDFVELESIDVVIPEPPAPPAPAAPAPTEPPVSVTPAPPAPAPVEPSPAPAAREAPAPIEPHERPPALPEVAREAPPVPEEPRRSSPELKGRRRAILDVPVSTPVVAAHPEVVLGIDLGTSHARVAVHHQGTLRLIPLGEAQSLPSLLAVDESGEFLVGAAARAEAGRNPRHAVLGLRRFLGLRAHSPLVRALGGPLPFPIIAGPRGDISIELRGGSHLLPELAARLLRELKSAATAFLGHDAARTVLCVPAHFDDRQRAAMREAGTLAGLNVLRILNAPSAAALAF